MGLVVVAPVHRQMTVLGCGVEMPAARLPPGNSSDCSPAKQAAHQRAPVSEPAPDYDARFTLKFENHA